MAPACFITMVVSGVLFLEGREVGTYSDDQYAAKDTTRHDKGTTAEKDKEFEFLAPGKTGFKQDLRHFK